MIDANASFERLRGFDADLCVIGGGPVGIVTALALGDRGFRVLLLESGGTRPTAAAQALSEAENLNPASHHAPHITVARRLGGASNLWGGRCLPYDAIDFRARPWLGLDAWPIAPADLEPYLGPACEGLAAGRPVYHEPLGGVTADAAFSFDTLERWSNIPRTQVLHKAALEGRADLLVALGATALGFGYDDGRAHRGGRAASGRAGAGDPRRAGRGAGGRRQREHAAACSPSSAGPLRASAARTARSGGSTWAMSTARSPTSPLPAARCTTG